MKDAEIEPEMDALYQLPLDQFTPARNALAKRVGGPLAADIKALQKPPVAAWAVNQLYWQRRESYDRLIESATTMRAAHAAVLSGSRADLRSAGKEHEEALEAALKATIALLQEGGHPVTDATRQAISSTLRGLPADAPPGRLSRTLQPGGFEMLAGIPVKGSPAPKTAAARPAAPPAATSSRAASKAAPVDQKAMARAREAVDSAARALKIAEQAARREEFEAARAAREAEKSATAVEAAREEVTAAEQALAEAEKEQTAAERRRDAAVKRAGENEEAVSAARAKLTAAERDLQTLTKKAR